MNSENILAVNIPNMVTVTIMAMVGFFLFNVISALMRRGTAKPTEDG